MQAGNGAKPAGELKKSFAVQDLLQASATPVKRSRPSGAGLNSGIAGTSSPEAAYGSSTRPIAGGPSRLKSSPAGPASSSGGTSPTTPASSSTPFALRPTPFTIQDSLNGHLPLPSRFETEGDSLRTMLYSAMKIDKYNYRYMREKLSERSDVLDSAIDEAADTLAAYYGIEEIGDPSVQSQEDILVVGRICPESDTTKLTPVTTWFESSRILGNGQRVLLGFSDDMKVRGAPVGSGGVGFFPGCLVGLKGRNGSGTRFVVNEVLMMPPMDATYTRPSELLSSQYGVEPKQLGGNPLSVIVASGPFTVEKDLDYAPLRALLDRAQTENPDLLILLGPFVDAEHPLLKSGNVDQTPTQIFRQEISSKLIALMTARPRVTIILIPNGRDLVNVHVGYPQSPFQREELGLPKKIKCLPNPTTFSVNEVVFGITSVDVLFHLRNQEMFAKCGEAVEVGETVAEDPNAKDIMARTCRHLLRQRSFYPLFPCPLPSKGIDTLNLDITHNDLVRMSSASGSADIIIVPSLLKHFTKIVDSTIVLNPSFLTRANAPGTYARLTVHPLPRDELERRVVEVPEGAEEPDEPIEHRVWERCRVDVVKV